MRLCVRSSVSRPPELTSQWTPSRPGLSAPGLALPGGPAPGLPTPRLAVPPDGFEDVGSPGILRPHGGPRAAQPGASKCVDLADHQVERAVAVEIGVHDRAGVPAELDEPQSG